MLNIHDLEKRWLRYKIKSYIPHVAILLTLTIALLVSILYISSEGDNSLESKTQTARKSVTVIPTGTPTPIAQPIVKKIEIEEKPVIEKRVEISQVAPTVAAQNNKEKKIKLKPSMDFMRKINNSANPYYSNESNEDRRDKPEASFREDNAKSKQSPKPTPQYTSQKSEPIANSTSTQEVKQQHINIKRQNTQNDIHDIIKRFKKNNNPALSLFVAKKYYELGNYRQAYNYSLMTNKINKDIESSWVVFAKSLVKLGKKDKAIETLTEYLKHSDSNGAQILLDEIQSGKFR